MKNTKQILAAKERIEHTGAEVPSAGRRTAATGTRDPRKRRWEKAVWKRGFFPSGWCFSHLFPRFPGISHLFPLNFYFMTKRSKISPQPRKLSGSSIRRRGDAEVNAKFRGKNYGFFGFPSPPRDGCPMELFAARNVVAKVRKSSDCFTKLRESSRKFAQIRAVVTRCYALLRVGGFFRREFRKLTRIYGRSHGGMRHIEAA